MNERKIRSTSIKTTKTKLTTMALKATKTRTIITPTTTGKQ